MHSLRSAVPALTIAPFLVLPLTVPAQERVDTLRVQLSGEEVVGGGDEDGSGSAMFAVEPDTDRVCYELRVQGITEATAAHVHRAPAAQEGPPVMTLAAPTSGVSSDCTTVDGPLIEEILHDPAGFYVNVHNPDFPGGAIRGQLTAGAGSP